MVEIGKAVTSFSLPATGDQTISLDDLKGKRVVLFFYPKDNTPGCTNESVAFSNAYDVFQAGNVTILGVSRDTIPSHEKFKAKFNMPFELLSDKGEELCKMFDVIREKNMYGRKIFGIQRSTFIIDEEGVLQKEWRNVKVKGHAEEVMAELGLSAGDIDLEACRIPAST